MSDRFRSRSRPARSAGNVSGPSKRRSAAARRGQVDPTFPSAPRRRSGAPRPSAAGRASVAPSSGGLQRLQKVMAASGIDSRRHCEELILEGRVEVDGQVVQELGTRVDPATQEIRVDGVALKPTQPVYYLVNKPVGVVTTNYDQAGRPRVIDLVPPANHLFAVGRLDKSSEGLILVTNDGGLANRLAHPRFGVEKRYRVIVAGHPTLAELQQLREGVYLAEGRVQVADLRVVQRQKKNTVLEMVLTEGRNREIRRMLARIGHKVFELRRVSFGPLRLGNIPPGAYRPLSPAEVRSLQHYRPGGPTKRKKGSRPKGAHTSGVHRQPHPAKPSAATHPTTARKKPTRRKSARPKPALAKPAGHARRGPRS